MARKPKTWELLPPEQARSYEEFCVPAAEEREHCQVDTVSGRNLLAAVVAGPTGSLGIFFFIAVADPDPAWWQWAGAFGFTGLALWIISRPLRRVVHQGPRYFELRQLWHVWHGWLQQEAVPYDHSQVEGFSGPDGEPSVAWRLWPDGDESALARPRPPESASTDEQFRARLAYEQALCVYRPLIGSRGQNFLAWFAAAVGIVLAVDFVSNLLAVPSWWDVLGLLGSAAFASGALWLPFRDFRHDIPRFLQLRRLWKAWADQYEGELKPAPPPPPQYTFNGYPGVSELP